MQNIPKPAIELEICLESGTANFLESLQILELTKVDRIELCASMSQDGLTPSESEIEIARKFFSGELIVMVRPRGGNFIYDSTALSDMVNSIKLAKDLGANGVVLGLLNSLGEIDQKNTSELVDTAKKLGLKTTFHRAFDATSDRRKAISFLNQISIDRVLSSGITWKQKGTVQDGLKNIISISKETAPIFEWVLGGGITTSNVHSILEEAKGIEHYSLHLYSGILTNGMVDADKVKIIQRIL